MATQGTSGDTMDVDMGVDESRDSGLPKQEEEEQPLDPLRDALESADEISATSPNEAIQAYQQILRDERDDEAAHRVKEDAIYRLAKLHAQSKHFKEVMSLLHTANPFFAQITKAKTAKIVRTIIDTIARVPDSAPLQIELCRQLVAWCNSQKRTFLRQRIEARLSALLFEEGDYTNALTLISKLLRELKKFDDKNLLVDTHLIEARINHALRNLPKAKAALTAARAAGNSVYVIPITQAELDQMSGILHCEEGDYKTSYSYFLEAFEGFDQQSDSRAIQCLQYMILSSILQVVSGLCPDGSHPTAYTRGTPGEVSVITSKHGLKYNGDQLSALVAIAQAAKERSLEKFDDARNQHSPALTSDLLVKHHISVVYDQLLESNLLKIVEPFSCVEISHVAQLINLTEPQVERKLSQMILDNKILGTLDQGQGYLLIYEGNESDKTFTYGLDVIRNLGLVVDSLTRRAQKLMTTGHSVGGAKHAQQPAPTTAAAVAS